MTRPFLLSPKHLKEQAHSKMEPEFAAATKELELAHRHADEMLENGRLTKAEHEDFESHLYSKFLDALPPSEFARMLEDGSIDDLQKLGGHDGTRDGGDVDDARRSIEARIKHDALQNAWADSQISGEYFAKESQRVDHDVHLFNEDLSDAIAEGDYDKAALHYFVERHDVHDHDRDLSKYLKDKYGDKAPGPDTKRNSSYDKPEGYVEVNPIADAPYASTNAFNKALTDAINEPAPSDGIVSYD